jgi:hypothetical protein
MVSILSLWLPILLSAVFVFIVSSIIHMVIAYHKNDFKKVPDEDGVIEALSKFNIPPGDYTVPCAGGPKGMSSPEFVDKMKRGPVLLMTVIPPGPPTLGTALLLWFIYSIVVSLFAGYVAAHALGPRGPYLDVFRFVGTVAFVGYSLALLQTSIWYKRNWGTTFKVMFDGLIYALVTAGTFGWLWPR